MHVVLNWLWQGGALSAVAAIALRAAPHFSATTRYLVWWATMILVLLLPALPWLMTASGAPVATGDAVPAIAAVALPQLPTWPIIAAAVWALWCGVMFVRVMGSFVGLIQARRGATPFPPAREARLPYWSSVRSTGRRARLVCSDRVASAAVLGLGDAVIAVSPAAAARLTDEELDQVLLHEWAHVQRHDDFARLAQVAVRMVAGMHPAVWWIGRRLEIEREIACDDYAVNITGKARSLALCLTKLADAPQGTLGATLAPGALIPSQLTLRVLRLLDPLRNTSTRRVRGLFGSVAAALAVVAVALSHLELVVAATPLALPVPAAIGDALRHVPLQPPAVEDRAEEVAGTLTMPITAPVDRIPTRTQPSAAQTSRPAPPAVPPTAEPPSALTPIEHSLITGWSVPELPAVSGAVLGSSAPGPVVPATENAADRKAVTPWGAAADAGISVGHGSQKAAAATADAGTTVGRSSQKAAVAAAGFFSKLGRKIAGGF